MSGLLVAGVSKHCGYKMMYESARTLAEQNNISAIAAWRGIGHPLVLVTTQRMPQVCAVGECIDAE